MISRKEFVNRAIKYSNELNRVLNGCDCPGVRQVQIQRYRLMEGLEYSPENYSTQILNALQNGSLKLVTHDVENFTPMGVIPKELAERFLEIEDSVLTAHCSSCDVKLEVIITSKFDD